MREKFKSLDFRKIEIEIEYSNDQEFEIEIKEKKDGRIKAEVEDEINHIKIKDPLEAFNYLYPFVSELTISQSTSKDAAIREILEVFNMEKNYKEFEAEFTFRDGTSIEYNDK